MTNRIPTRQELLATFALRTVKPEMAEMMVDQGYKGYNQNIKALLRDIYSTHSTPFTTEQIETLIRGGIPALTISLNRKGN